MKSLFLHSSGRWYYRQCIPLDLRNHFGGRADIAQSLKTKNKADAKNLAAQLQFKFLTTFTLLRTGVVNNIAPTLISDFLLKPKLNIGSGFKTQDKEEKTVNDTVKLSMLFDMYIKEHAPGWKPKTLSEFTAQMELLRLIIGDIYIKDISRSDCVNCRDMLRQIPPGYRRKKDLCKLPAKELIKIKSTGLATKTVNIHMQLLSSAFRSAVKYGLMLNNPAEGLSLSATTKPDEQRKPFDASDLQKVIDNLPSENCAEKWIPLVAMYSGMRLEEIAQLTSEDIREVDGVLCFDLFGKNIKTESSARLIPVHSILVAAGLNDFVESVPANQNLWGLEVYRGGWGKRFGKTFGRWLRANITKDPKKVFHSFRHSVADSLKLAVVPEPLTKQIMGHTNSDITTGRYGSKYPQSSVREAIEEIKYNIDLQKVIIKK